MSIKTLLTALISILLIVMSFPASVKAEATITTNKDVYDENEPIIVTAEGGEWVRIYKADEDPAEKREKYYYSFEVKDEPQNIYNGIKGNRGSSSFYGLPWKNDFIAVLFADENYDTEVARVEFSVPKPSKFYNSISVDPSEYLYGDRIFVAASSNSEKPHVGIFEGHIEFEKTAFADLTEVRSFFPVYANNEGMYIEDLPVGQYTAVMFGGETQGNAVNHAYFEVKEREAFPAISTEKSEFEIGEEISVLTYYSGEDAWVGLYEKDAVPGEVDPIYSYSLSGELPQRMSLTEGTAVRPDDFVPGEYKIVLFGDSSTSNIVSSVDITVSPVQTGTIKTDKTKYKVNEPIMVSAEGGTWIGIYKSGENPSTVQEKYFYKIPASSEWQNIYSGIPGERGTSFIASIPKTFKLEVFLFGDSKYSKILDSVTIQTVSTKEESVLEVNEEFKEDEEVIIHASSNERDAWVGIYSGQYSETDSFSSITPVEQFYVIHKDNVGGSIGVLPVGYYTAVLFSEGDHVVDKTVQFKVSGNEKILLSTNSDSYKESDNIYVITDFYKECAWVGMYVSEEWNAQKSAAKPVIRYDLLPEQPQTVNILDYEILRPDDFVSGDYTVVLFEGPESSESLAEKTIHILRPETVVLTEVDCENYGYLRVTDTTGKAQHVIVDPLGHDWSEWTFDAETRTHSRVCKRNSEHKDTEWCIFGEGVVEQEALAGKPGVIRYTCKECGGSYTETYELKEKEITRVSGKDRYLTSMAIAKQLKTSMGVEKFDSVILASGVNYPDALSGAYLAYQVKAPILVIRDKEAQTVAGFVKENLKEGGTVYILGGEAAVSGNVEALFSGYNVKRLSGKTRYDTNLAILNSVDIGTEDILICTGKGFADSLSASAVKRPILLVKDELNDAQRAFLEAHKDNRFYIIGGEGAVNAAVAEQVAEIHEYKRISGKTRYVTSVLIAEEFFKDPSTVILAYGQNFPDALGGGPLAIAENSPLILTREKDRNEAANYCDANAISRGFILGGDALINDETADYILADPSAEEGDKTYRINYILNDGFGSLENPTSYKTGDAITLIDPVRKGYIFDGWYTEELLLRRFMGFTSRTKGNLNLYAKWREIDEAPIDITVTGMENMIWSWWYTPQVISTEDKVFWGFAGNDGYGGVAQYDIATGKTKKTLLKKAPTIDDHNGVAITLLDDGRILCVYAGGHNKDKLIYARISNEPYDVENFDTQTILTSSGKTCYSQLLHYKDKIYLFYRVNNNNWAYRETEDGIDWSDEVILVTSPEQYYCKFTATTTDGLLRVTMYTNPAGSDPSFRMGFFDLEKKVLLNSDGTTVVGTDNVPYKDFHVLIDKPETGTQRLLDVAVSDPDKPKILYAVFNESKTTLNSSYYLYDGGAKIHVCEGGYPLWNPKYQLGAAFVGNDRIILGRNENNTDYIELYSIGSGAVTLEESIYSEEVVDGVRNARPIADINGKVILWHRGYYNEEVYTDFDTSAKMHFLP
ncbi:MAG: cell wall-binding repeat-containing protein [Erysipelotrichaceae bacterium]|nr:cell wall-binding repeat-containing protein [Erysipelotrichaceae bacterium]